MRRALVLNPLEDPRWDRLARRHPLSWLSHTSGWLRALVDTFPQLQPAYLGLENDAGEIQAGLPLALFESRITGRRLISLPYTTLCDPLVRDRSELSLLLQAAVDLQVATKARYLEIRSCLTGSELSQSEALVTRSDFVFHTIDLKRPLPLIKRGLSRKAVRPCIHRAERLGLTVRRGASEQDVNRFYRLYLATRSRLGLPTFPRDLYHAWWKIFSRNGEVVLFLVEKDDKLLSALWTFVYNGCMSAESIGWDERFASWFPNHAAFWAAIEWAHEQGLHRFDFGRTPVDQPHLLQFKDRWGAERHPLIFAYHPVTILPGGSWLPSLQAVARWWFRSVPQVVLERMSKMVYRHVG